MLHPHLKPRALLLEFPAWAAVPENLHRLIELLNLQWLLQNRDRADCSLLQCAASAWRASDNQKTGDGLSMLRERRLPFAVEFDQPCIKALRSSN
jgi:hypothetical protein